MASAAAPVRRLDVTAYRVPTEGGPESDGTLVWDATTLVLVEIEAADHTGIGYTYADTATAVLIRDMLAKVVVGRDVVDHGSIWSDLVAAIPQSRSRRHHVDGDLGHRHRTVGSAWKAVEPPSNRLARRRPNECARLRQRRFHVIRSAATVPPVERLGRFRHPA